MTILSTAGWGVDLDANGNGTNSSDVRKVWGGLFSPGIIDGCVITRGNTMSYAISAGVVAIAVAPGETVMVPVSAATTPAPASPASGTGTVTVYVRQRSEDSKAEVVATAGSVPTRSQVIGKFSVAAGQTTTDAAIPLGGIDFSIPYGSSLGVLHQHRTTDNNTFTGTTTHGTGTFYLPTDRLLRVSLLTSLSAFGAAGFDNAQYCEVAFNVKFDGVKKWRWNTPGLSQAWGHYFWSDYVTTTAGQHTVSYDRLRQSGPGTPAHHYLAGEMPGTLFSIEDVGPVQ